jgi:hypothetical protein
LSLFQASGDILIDVPRKMLAESAHTWITHKSPLLFAANGSRY